MDEKLVTLALLPYSQAEVLRSRLEAEGIECTLTHVNLLQGAVSSGVRVHIRAEDMRKAYPLLDVLLGKADTVKLKMEDVILVPVDFSDYSFKAALVAFEIARMLNSKLLFYHVVPQPDFFTVPYSDVIAFDAGFYDHLKEQEEEARTNFDVFAKRLIDRTGRSAWEKVRSEHIVKMGYPEDDILAYAEKHPPRLIVMGIRGPSEGLPYIMGSTTAGVIYDSKVPVLVMPEKADLLPVSSVKKVVYATNFDDKDFVSLEKLYRLLKPFDTHVCCLHVGKAGNREWIEARLGSMESLIKKKYPDMKFECVAIEGDDFLGVLETYIEQNHVDVLSLTTHKRNIITRIFNPSIARKMVFHAKTPLLVFHS